METVQQDLSQCSVQNSKGSEPVFKNRKKLIKIFFGQLQCIQHMDFTQLNQNVLFFTFLFFVLFCFVSFLFIVYCFVFGIFVWLYFIWNFVLFCFSDKKKTKTYCVQMFTKQKKDSAFEVDVSIFLGVLHFHFH